MADDHQRYRIDECVRPGLIESWSGLDRTLDRPVTIRLLDPSTEVGKRVELQARALVRRLELQLRLLAVQLQLQLQPTGTRRAENLNRDQ